MLFSPFSVLFLSGIEIVVTTEMVKIVKMKPFFPVMISKISKICW